MTNSSKVNLGSGMHRAAFFASGQVATGHKKNFVGWGGTGQGAKSSGQGGAIVKLGAFSGWGRAVLKIFKAGRSRASIFPGAFIMPLSMTETHSGERHYICNHYQCHHCQQASWSVNFAFRGIKFSGNKAVLR